MENVMSQVLDGIDLAVLVVQEQFMENVMSQVLDGIDLAVLVVTGAVHGERDESGAGWY